MWDTIRESSLGQLARLLSRRPDLLPYPEELDSFQLPITLVPPGRRSNGPSALLDDSGSGKLGEDTLLGKKEEEQQQQQQQEAAVARLSPFSTGTATPAEEKDLEAATVRVSRAEAEVDVADSWPSSTATLGGVLTMAPVRDDDRDNHDNARQEAEPKPEPEAAAAAAVAVVHWYDHNNSPDASNPRNWSLAKKLWVTALMGLYTFAVYVGSSLYAPTEAQVSSNFGTSRPAASLGMALYVLGYGLGPALWSPLSEVPGVGRTSVYVATLLAFVALALGAAVVDRFAGLLALRFLLGFFGSPCLATAGATLDDMFAPWKLPYVLTVWSSAGSLGPALGPVVSGFAVDRMGWRWAGWELFWLAGPAWVLLFVGLPETNPDAILHRRAARLRRLTGRQDLTCEADLRRAHMSARQVIIDALIKPWQINALDPAVLYTTVYSAVLYGTYYSFFEAFPLVFADMYGFDLGQSGLPFLAFVPGLLIAVPSYIAWFRIAAEPVMRRMPPPLYGHPEGRLLPAVATTFLTPFGLFLFAWTSRPDIHWMVPIMGLMVLFVSVVIAFQCMNFYISRCYPKYSASLFAANTFARSSFAAGSILLSTPMYKAMSVGGGVSLLGGLAVLCSAGMIYLYHYGDKLRIRSRFAQSF
ncbi:MFS general substrate transporter [Hypoxylon sp. NC1633]|nr:MFS general substrate transporter [Hypoxylon sp. NC1633]